MKISLIAAMDQNRLIGNNNQLPWHLSEDLRHFKALTIGKPIIMGRNTFESIGKALPGRQNIVLTSNKDWTAEGVDAADSLEAGIALAGDADEIMIIGGVKLYQFALPVADCMYLTLIEQSFEGDAHFPAWDESEWQETSRETQDIDFVFHFVTLIKQDGKTG